MAGLRRYLAVAPREATIFGGPTQFLGEDARYELRLLDLLSKAQSVTSQYIIQCTGRPPKAADPIKKDRT